MSLDYLKFVESQEKYKDFNIFEKVLMATQRAKAIYEEEKIEEEEEEQNKLKNKRKVDHKPTYRAILEINEGKIGLTYSATKTTLQPLEELEADTSSESQTIPE